MNSETPKIRRLDIVGGVFTPVLALIDCDQLAIGNAGEDDLEVYSLDAVDGDTDKHLVLPAGYERTIHTTLGWRTGAVVVNLKRDTTGTVILIWG